MKYAYDLHIHTALSACCDDDMTPNNIVNMAVLKELDFIAVTDHNTAGNLRAVLDAASDKDIIIIPGIEAESAESIHVLCYFKTIQAAEEMAKHIQANMTRAKNKIDIFGRQLYFDYLDNIIATEEDLLSISCNLSIQELIDYCHALDGVAVPAHIDKQAYSIVAVFGEIPEDIGFSAVELSKNSMKGNFKLDSDKYIVLYNSDAHFLYDISEREHFVELEQKDIKSLFDFLLKKH